MKSSLGSSYRVEYNDPYRTFAESLEQIALAEKFGLAPVLVTEHHLVENRYFPAPLVVGGAIAMRTTRLRIGRTTRGGVSDMSVRRCASRQVMKSIKLWGEKVMPHI